MAETELNAEDQAALSESKPEAPKSALETLDEIEAEKAAKAAGAEKPVEAADSKDTVVKIVNVEDASRPAPEAQESGQGSAEADSEPVKLTEHEVNLARIKDCLARCEKIGAEIRGHEKAIEELNSERSKLVKIVKDAREIIRPPLHVLNKQQALITAEERESRFATVEALRRLGPMTQRPRVPYPPKFKIK